MCLKFPFFPDRHTDQIIDDVANISFLKNYHIKDKSKILIQANGADFVRRRVEALSELCENEFAKLYPEMRGTRK